jgi:hypothetical protein
MSWLSPGVEFFGGVGLIDDNDPPSRQQHYVFPVMQGELLEGIRIQPRSRLRPHKRIRPHDYKVQSCAREVRRRDFRTVARFKLVLLKSRTSLHLLCLTSTLDL